MQRKWLPIFPLILGTLIGAGGVGEWHRRQLEKAKHIQALREQMETHLIAMADLYRKHAMLIHVEYMRSPDSLPLRPTSPEIDRLWTQEFPVITGNIEHCERLLAHLENRPPKAYDFRPPPPPPTASPVGNKKKTLKGPRQKANGILRTPRTPPQFLQAGRPTTRDNLFQDDYLDRGYTSSE